MLVMWAESAVAVPPTPRDQEKSPGVVVQLVVVALADELCADTFVALSYAATV
jgi:hypothetical protein